MRGHYSLRRFGPKPDGVSELDWHTMNCRTCQEFLNGGNLIDGDSIEASHWHVCPECGKEYQRPLSKCPREEEIKFPDRLVCYDCAARRNEHTTTRD